MRHARHLRVLIHFFLNYSTTRGSQFHLLNNIQNCSCFYIWWPCFSWGLYRHVSQTLLEPPISSICCLYLKLDTDVIKSCLKVIFQGLPVVINSKFFTRNSHNLAPTHISTLPPSCPSLHLAGEADNRNTKETPRFFMPLGLWTSLSLPGRLSLIFTYSRSWAATALSEPPPMS